MSLAAAWVVYPLVLLALCLGIGLLVDVLCGRRLPGVLIAPTGLAGIVVAGGFATAFAATAQLTVPLVCFGAVLGAGFSIPWRFGRPDPWPVATALAVFAVFAAPVVLSGEPTFAGYIKLDDTATWLALTDRVMEHGRSLGGLEPSTYRATLEFNLAGGYPVGVFIPFGTAQKLVNGDLAWVFQPYLTFLAAMLSLCLWQVAGGLLRDPRPRALAAFVAAQPALLYGYALWGGIKEVAAAALLALAAALAPAAVRRGGRAGDVLPLAVAAAALAEVLSPGGLVWLGPMLLALAYLATRRFGWPGALARAGLFAAALAALSAPALASGLVPPTSKPLVGSNGEGNLRGPLSAFQALGIWPSGDFRFHPDATVATAVLVALGILAALLGLWAAWRRRALAPLLLATALISAGAIVLAGSPWAGGKALATISPAALSLAILGAVVALRFDRLSGAVLVAVVAGGVLWSNVLAYGGVDLAPYGQLRELERIGHEFAGQGPTLMTEYNPYGARHFLREEDGEGASELRTREVALREGGTAKKGEAVDTDQLGLGELLEFRTLVLRRSPVRSRPPSPYRLVWAGRYYEVWQRPLRERLGAIPEHQPFGSGLEPAAVPSCGEIGEIARRARRSGGPNARMLAAAHAPLHDATGGTLAVPRPGVYEAWLKGSARGAVALYVDGRKVGEVRQQLENDGGWLDLGNARLGAGLHRAELRFGGADLHPGSGGFPRPETGPLLFTPAGREVGRLVTAPVADWRRLCGGRWDWIEAIDR